MMLLSETSTSGTPQWRMTSYNVTKKASLSCLRAMAEVKTALEKFFQDANTLTPL